MNKKVVVLLVLCALAAMALFVVVKSARRSTSVTDASPGVQREESSVAETAARPPRAKAPKAVDVPSRAVAKVEGVRAAPYQAIEKTGGRLSSQVALAIGLTPEKGYQQRVEAIGRIGRKLGRDDVEAIYGFFDAKSKDQGDLDQVSFSGVKNDLMNALIAQDRMPEDLGRRLLAMYRNRDNDELWRDYCLQHCVPYYERKWPDPAASPDDQERREFVPAFRDAFKERGSHIAGTALIGWDCLSAKYPEFDPAEAAKVALELVKDDKCCVASKATAMSVCGSRGLGDALPLARIMAQAGEETSLRLAATAALGALGGKDDEELLMSMGAGKDRYQKMCAASALKNLRQRIEEKK
jgi:hypothetical protein